MDGGFAAHINRGSDLYAQKKYEEALEANARALDIDPSSPVAWTNRGAALSALGRQDEALEAYARATALGPDYAAAFNNLGDCLNIVGRHEEAVETLKTALRLRPDHPQAHCNLGGAFWGLGRYDEAESAFRKAVSLDPYLWAARKNLGMLLLQKGRYAEGWAEYDWRFLADGCHLRPATCPVWNGEATGGELLICGEQGLGDQILQASMLGDLVTRGQRLAWDLDGRLIPLLQRSFPGVRFMARFGNEAGGFAAQYPAASLGRLLRADRAAFPGCSYLKADPARAAEIAARLGLRGERLVGISWRSENKDIGRTKSTDFSDWAGMLKTPGVRFVSLQYGADESGLAVDGLDATNDIDGLAALISLCDAVVTVSNTTAHLAGALGVPTFVLIGAGRGKLWCWGTEDKTPWYPAATLIRRRYGDPWTIALETATEHLSTFLEGGMNACA